jgi:hypothetical protein
MYSIPHQGGDHNNVEIQHGPDMYYSKLVQYGMDRVFVEYIFHSNRSG